MLVLGGCLRLAAAGVLLETATSWFSCSERFELGIRRQESGEGRCLCSSQPSGLGFSCRAAFPVSVPVSSICNKSNVDLL